MSPLAHPDLHALAACLDHPDAAGCDAEQRARLRADLAEAALVETAGRTLIVRGPRALGRVLPFGSVALYLPTPPRPLAHRVIEVDRHGRVVLAVRRAPAGALRSAWVRTADGTALEILPGGASHPPWGASDRIVRAGSCGGAPEVLTVSAAVDWDAVATIPPLADPTRLSPGAGTGILNLLASLAVDQGGGPLRYRGPYPTEQLFWALTESWRFDATVPDPLERFAGDGEAAFAAGAMRAAPLDWTPAPHERLFLDDGLCVQLRDGVEKVYWEGRPYYRLEWQGLGRREHRVVRTVSTPDGRLTFVASIEALGRTIEDHLVLDSTGDLLDRPAPAVDRDPDCDTPLAGPWVEALGTLLPLEATPLLGTAIAAVWPGIRIVWGRVARDLVEATGTTVRLSPALVRAYRDDPAHLAAERRRGLAQRLVREVLGLVGPPVRRAAAAWLEAEPPARQATHLEVSARLDRAVAAARAAEPLGRLLAALEAGEALPP